MMKFSYFFAFVFLFSCENDQKSENQKSKKNNIPVGNEIAKGLDIKYELSNTEILTEKDSLSYVLGIKISQQFHVQPDFSDLDRDLIYKGFSDAIGTYDINACFSDIEAYMASESTRKNKVFADACGISVGRLTKDEFSKNMERFEALDLFNDSALGLGFYDGLNLKNIFKNNPENEERIFNELNQKLELKNREIVLRGQKEGEEFLKKNRNKKGVLETKSGIQYKVLRKGKGSYPTATSRVKVNYKGSMLSGEEFDSSYKRGKPSEFGLNQVIPGWTEGIQLMRSGSKFIFYIPQELAYGANPDPRSGIKPYSLLIFEVELLEII